MTIINDTLADTVATAGTTIVGRTQLAAETMRVVVDTLTNYGRPVTLAETVGTHDALTTRYALLMREAIGIARVLLPNQKANLTLNDALRLVDATVRGLPTTLSDTIGVAPTQAQLRGVLMLERLGLTGAGAGAAIFSRTLADVLHLADSLGNFFHGSLADGLGVLAALNVSARTAPILAEHLGLSDSLTPRLLLNVVTADTIDISADDAIQMLYTADMLDGVEISALYLSPGGEYSAWVMNTRTGWVTEYSNYQFNSFAQHGHTYLGASETGLYELAGNTDDGAAIISRIKSGYMQFGGPKLSRLAAAYLAARGEGDYVLRILTGEGAVYNYAVSTQNMHTAKVHMGKGQRARYFAFELISSGQDFDLDTLEFVPIVVQRRV